MELRLNKIKPEKRLYKLLIINLLSFFIQFSLFAGKEENNYIKNLNYENSRNITKEYQSIEKETNLFFDKENTKIKNVKVIFLPGYLSKEIVKLYEYFDEQMKFLSSLGIENEKLGLTSAKGIDVNADIIIESIKKEKKQIIIISHSKGGLDFLNALIKSSKKKDTAWTKKIRGWIAIQSPFYGSPVADDVDKLKILTKGLLFLFDGEYKSLEDLMIKNRKKYMAENSELIRFWLSQIPTLSLTTYVAPVEFKNMLHYLYLGGQNTVLAGVRDYYFKKQIYMDGLNPFQSGILPNTDYILFDNVDHLSTVSKNKYNQFERIEFTKKAIYLIFKKNKLLNEK